MKKFENLNIYERTTLIIQSIQLFIGILGIIGNFLAFLVFSRKPLKPHSYAFYSRIVIWTDSFVLLNVFRHWLRIVADVNIDLIGPFFCRFNEYSAYSAGSISIWLRMIILFDRLVRVAYPAYFKILRRKWFQLTSVSLIFASNFFLHIILPLNFQLVETIEPPDNSIRFTCYLPRDILGFNFILVLANLSSCTLFTIILNLKLISSIYKSRNRVSKNVYRRHLLVVKDRNFAICSIVISFLNFLSQLVFGLSTLLALMLGLNPDQIQLVFTSSLILPIVNCNSVFYVNLLMNSFFNREFLRLFGIKMRGRRRRRQI